MSLQHQNELRKEFTKRRDRVLVVYAIIVVLVFLGLNWIQVLYNYTTGEASFYILLVIAFLVIVSSSVFARKIANSITRKFFINDIKEVEEYL